MMRPGIRAATKHPWLAVLGAASLVLAASGCEAPAHAAVVKCSGSVVVADIDDDVKKDCTLAIAKFDRQTSASIRIDTGRRLAFVKGHFTVQQGTVRISLHGSTGTAAEVVVRPGSPGDVEALLRLNRRNNGFHLRFDPDVEAVGLDGTLSYEAR
ncbi:hypothetical protein LDO26_02690 [Luteimonas sp. BDR2-5]|uniref:hypothetical protein n=1 Tax=Proluteimonas luteida TaxID=2878685 RepID=UPI001E379A11|nr:hypothetical protein [Luteimonas sp. BDR2-5]MCD9027121.1 hypothetical protein [Luteimonas sp. BDR2-5]